MMVRSFHDNATRLLSFFSRSVASYIFWYWTKIFRTKSWTWKYSWSFKKSLRANFSLKNRWFSRAYARFVLLTYFITTLESDGPRVSVRSFPANSVFIYFKNSQRQYSILWSRKHIDKARSHLPISWLKSLYLLIRPMSSTRDKEDCSSNHWSQNQYTRDNSCVITITPTSFGKNKVPNGKCKNHTNPPQIRKREKPTVLRFYPLQIRSFREWKFENHKCTGKRAQNKGHDSTRPKSDMKQNILPPRPRRDIFCMNISEYWISHGSLLCTVYCVLRTFHARHR